MPMMPKTMGDQMAAAIQSAAPDPKAAVTPAQLQTIMEGVAQAIVSHITTNALVTVQGTGLTSPTGPVSGVAQGTIS